MISYGEIFEQVVNSDKGPLALDARRETVTVQRRREGSVTIQSTGWTFETPADIDRFALVLRAALETAG